MEQLSRQELLKVKQKYQGEIQLYQSMFGIGLEQEKAIRSRNLKRLLSLLSQREEIITRISQIDKEMLPLRTKYLQFKNCSEKEEIAILLKKLTGLLKKMLVQEEKNDSLMRKFIQATGEDLRHIQTARASHNAYRAHPISNPRFMDQKT